jgi:hypothetical protein
VLNSLFGLLTVQFVMITYGCNMGLRLRYWHSRLDYFPDNVAGEGSSHKKKVKVITKILKEMQRRCQGRWDVNKMAGYCSPSNERPPAGEFTGQHASTGSQRTERTDFLPHVQNSKET